MCVCVCTDIYDLTCLNVHVCTRIQCVYAWVCLHICTRTCKYISNKDPTLVSVDLFKIQQQE